FEVYSELSYQCRLENSCTQTRRRRGICFLGRLDGGSAVAVVYPASSTRLLAAGAHLRPHLGHDGCGTRVSTAAGRMREQRQALAFQSAKFPSNRRTRRSVICQIIRGTRSGRNGRKKTAAQYA